MLIVINMLNWSRGVRRKAGLRPVGPAARGPGLDRSWTFFGAAVKRAIAALFLFTTFSMPAVADSRSELAQARHDLAVSEQVLARVAAQVEEARNDPATGPRERERLDQYLAHVRELVAQNRRRVRSLENGVQMAPAGLPAGSGGGTAGTPPAATRGEEVAALDTKLGGSLSEFDQLLLEEARKAQARAPSASAGEGYGGGSGSSKAGGQGARQAESKGTRANQPSQTENENASSRQAKTGPGSPGGRIDGDDPGTPGATAAIPPDVGNGNDDDIVARQIRKAAESETDPELRKKLWDEYRKYKQGTKG